MPTIPAHKAEIIFIYINMWAGYSYKLKLFGYGLHRARAQRFFVEDSEYIKQHSSDVLKAFFGGYITHYCLDYIMHPPIKALAPSAMKDHNRLEYAIDSMYARQNGIDAIEFDRADFVHQTTIHSDEISKFFDVMKEKLYYGFSLKPDSYHTTYRYFEKFNRKLYKPSKSQLRWMCFQNRFTILDLLTM
jgi:hypothetical protein